MSNPSPEIPSLHLDVVTRYSWSPPAREQGPPADRLLRLACMDYDDWHPSHAARARRMLAEQPSLSRASIYTAAAVGDVRASRDLLAADRSLAAARGGPLRWEPLLYVCYSRLDSETPGHSTLGVVRLLLEQGADPNARFLWRGNVPPFTALTGAFGEGENGNNQPRHRDCDALATLLLEHGADPPGSTRTTRGRTLSETPARFAQESPTASSRGPSPSPATPSEGSAFPRPRSAGRRRGRVRPVADRRRGDRRAGGGGPIRTGRPRSE